jgi:hypothetical protein
MIPSSFLRLLPDTQTITLLIGKRYTGYPESDAIIQNPLALRPEVAILTALRIGDESFCRLRAKSDRSGSERKKIFGKTACGESESG